MSEPDRPQAPVDEAAVRVTAEEVAAGKDSIAVPNEMVDEPAHPVSHIPGRTQELALWIRVRQMNQSERVKLALRGNQEARLILLRDVSAQIQRLVLQNPRITEEEILTIANDRNTDEEILSLIADSRDWTKVYSVRVALVENARTPVAKALRLLATLGEKELARLAKSKAVPNVVAVQARRLLFQIREQRH